MAGDTARKRAAPRIWAPAKLLKEVVSVQTAANGGSFTRMTGRTELGRNRR